MNNIHYPHIFLGSKFTIMNTQKTIIISVIAIIITGVTAFYIGMHFGQSNTNSFANLSPEERQQRAQQFGARGGISAGRGRNLGPNGDVAGGEILSQDDKSITLKLRDGGSRIVFFTNNIPVNKLASGSYQDLKVGSRVMITGTKNPDGSLLAESILLR